MFFKPFMLHLPFILHLRFMLHLRFLLRLPVLCFSKLLPDTCVLCGATSCSAASICQACHQDLPILSQCCIQCAAQLPHLPASETPLKCGKCLSHPPPFDRTYALFSYEPPIVKMVTELKFKHQLKFSKIFGTLLVNQLRHVWYHDKTYPQLIIPMPLHPARLKERGFNQALEIARPIAKALNIPLEVKSAIRHRDTSAQSGLTAVARQQNMRNAFTVNQTFAHSSIAVVDDVITTGHTMWSFCEKLKQCGAKQIDVWCCARRMLL